MGIFSNIFSSPSIEERLEKIYVPQYQSDGMSLSEARQAFKDDIEMCKEKGVSEGTANLPENFGDILLEKEKIDEKIRCSIERLRREGVIDQDIRWWWNMNDLERRMMIGDDDRTRITMFLHYVNVNKLSPEEASIRIKKRCYLYGEPNIKKDKIEDDDPLPFELKDRVNIYYTNRANKDFQKLLDEVEKFTSMNAFIRNEIKNGNI